MPKYSWIERVKSQNSAKIVMDSLENLCLKLIVDKFDKFVFAFCVTIDPDLKLDLFFLQRKYSLVLASKLHKRTLLCDRHMDFIINEHLKYLNGKWLSYHPHSYFCRSRTFRIDIGQAFCRLPNLKIMHFSDLCTDEVLENVAKYCKGIVEIDMRNSNVTDNGVKYLCQDKNGQVPCVKLKKILIEKTNVTNEGLNCLIQFLPSLEIIDSPSIFGILYSLHKEDFHLKSVQNYNLVELDILKLDKLEWHVDLLRVCFTVCPKLKSLACCIFTEEQLGVIKNDLDRLHLKFIKKARNVNINSFLELKGSSLSCLNIYNGLMSISVLAASCPKLKQLCIGNVTFPDNDDCSNSLTFFNRLNECAFKYIKNESSTNKAIFSLLSSKSLQSVSFSFCEMPINMKTLILNCCKNLTIKIISFECVIVEGNFMMDILSCCASLTNLNLKRCDLLRFDKELLYGLAESLPNKPIITAIKTNY